MHFQFDMSTVSFPPLDAAPANLRGPGSSPPDARSAARATGELRAFLGAHDGGARWRAFLERWRQDFADLPQACREALPILERSYGKLIAELTEQLCQNGSDALENDFALQEFLDRYGMRLTQLGTILNLVAPFAEAGSQSEST